MQEARRPEQADSGAVVHTGAGIEALAPVALGGEHKLVTTYIPAREGMPTVLLLHGWVMNRSTWADAVAPLADRGYGILLPDLPGHGASPPLGRVKNTEVYAEMARRLLGILNELGLERVALAGYSMGATAAAALVRLAPERIDRVLFMDPIVRFPLMQMRRAPLRLIARFAKNITTGFLRPRGGALMRAWFGLHVAGFWFPQLIKRPLLALFNFQKQDPTELSYVSCRRDCDVQLFLDGFVRTDWWTTAQTLEGKFRQSHMDVFRTFPRPIWVATGEDDAFASTNFLEKDLAPLGLKGPRGQRHTVRELKGHDHLAVCTDPEGTAQLLLDFLSEEPT